ncbi:hypothetical protein [Paenibacillus sp. HW567]|uniref:hypothetical protein n=1 Tax=Paenibacillus sp. HW567 TaxID=1034769 RepID=UPI00036DC6C8|nr:hypothetical protein [Paenibacillus sp. HW567]
MQYSAEERETTCVYDYIAGTWTVYTCVPTHMTKLRKIAQPIWEEKDGDRVTAAKWLLKSNQVRFAQEMVSKMTDEQKQAASLRLKHYNQKRDDNVVN